MKIGEELYYNMFSDGGALIKRTEEGYELYEIPLYGGVPRYYTTFNGIEKAKEVADRWT